MNVTDYASHDGVGIAGLISSGQVSRDEVLDAAYEALASVNPSVNAAVELYDRASLDRDAAAGPFAGVPSLRKDIHTEAGRRVEYGSRLSEGLVASETDAVLERMRSAGVVFLGRSATSEFALYGTTETALYGPTRNPWDLSKSAGGSSGGAAAAVASGAVPIADASDAGGSIRIPGSCCGLVGLKSSRKTVSRARSQGDLNENVHSILARSVRDIRTMSVTLGDTDGHDVDLATLSPRLRVALSVEPWAPRTTLDPEIIRAVEQVAHEMGDLGSGIEIARPRFDAEEFWDALLVRLTAGVHEECRALARSCGRLPSPEFMEPVSWMYFEAGARVRLPDMARAFLERDRTVQRVNDFFTRYDVLITPTLQVLVPDLGTAGGYDEVSSPLEHVLLGETVAPNLALFNMTGHPAITVPTGMSASGVPIGVQLVARYGMDSLLLALAGELETRLPWSHRRPTIHVSRM
jgi:amidase